MKWLARDPTPACLPEKVIGRISSGPCHWSHLVPTWGQALCWGLWCRQAVLGLSCQAQGCLLRRTLHRTIFLRPPSSYQHLLTTQASSLKRAQDHRFTIQTIGLWCHWAWGSPCKPRVHVPEHLYPSLLTHIIMEAAPYSCKAETAPHFPPEAAEIRGEVPGSS